MRALRIGLHPPVRAFGSRRVPQTRHGESLRQEPVQQFRAVREDMLAGKRRFLLKRESGSVICEFDLSDMPDFIAVLSGRANTVRLTEGVSA